MKFRLESCIECRKEKNFKIIVSYTVLKVSHVTKQHNWLNIDNDQSYPTVIESLDGRLESGY